MPNHIAKLKGEEPSTSPMDKWGGPWQLRLGRRVAAGGGLPQPAAGQKRQVSITALR